MNSRKEIQDFISQKTLAVVGMSRSPQSFGAYAVKELKAKGYKLYFVNPNARDIRQEKCYSHIAELPEKIHGALFVTPPQATEGAIREAVQAGVSNLWIQQGAESKEAITFCEEKNLSTISGHCILMFAEPVRSFHRLHRLFKGLFGGMPK